MTADAKRPAHASAGRSTPEAPEHRTPEATTEAPITPPIDLRTGTPATCARCHQQAETTLGAEALCAGHYGTIIDPILERVAVLDGQALGWVGIGIITRPRPDYGPGWYDVECNLCAAGWVGPAGDICTWCLDAQERAEEWQQQLTLTPPDVDPDDRRHAAAMTSWAERLSTAVAAGHITGERARRAWERATRADAA